MSDDKGAQSAMRFLEHLGFVFDLDWDDELTISYPDDVTGERVASELAKHAAVIIDNIKGRATQRRRHLVGGPFNGKPHGKYIKGDRIILRVKRAVWAIYVVGVDGRAWFKGYATSEAKGKRLELGRKKPA